MRGQRGTATAFTLYQEWGIHILERYGAQTVSARTHIWVDINTRKTTVTYGYSDRRISDVLKLYHRGLSLEKALDTEHRQFIIKLR